MVVVSTSALVCGLDSSDESIQYACAVSLAKIDRFPCKWIGSEKVASFMRPDEALAYLEKELRGGEMILFKGARYLEGIVEKLLADPADADKLCRREEVWAKKRKEWGV